MFNSIKETVTSASFLSFIGGVVVGAIGTGAGMYYTRGSTPVAAVVDEVVSDVKEAGQTTTEETE